VTAISHSCTRTLPGLVQRDKTELNRREERPTDVMNSLLAIFLRSLDRVGFIMPLRSSRHSRWRAMWQKTHDGAISHLPEDKWVNAAVERAMADGDVDLRG